MSYQIGIDTIFLRPTERIAHTEYFSNAAVARAVAGSHPNDIVMDDAWSYDFIWSVHDGPVDWAKTGRVTDMGHAEFTEHGADRNDNIFCPFKDVEEVLTFDAVKEYGLPEMKELIDFFEKHYQEGRKARPNQVFPGGYYRTVVSGAINSFGWDMLLQGAADKKRFGQVLDSYFRYSLHHFKAWAKTSIEVFICHDDMVWTQGAFMHPDFYREYIFPHYKTLWKVLKDAGKKVLFCSDGNFMEFFDDIAAAGADGFIFEPSNDLDFVVEKFGQTHVIVGSKVDCRTLTFGTKEKVKAEIDATLKLARKCPGFIFAVGNHFPSNIPVDTALFYIDYLRKNWRR